MSSFYTARELDRYGAFWIKCDINYKWYDCKTQILNTV